MGVLNLDKKFILGINIWVSPPTIDQCMLNRKIEKGFGKKRCWWLYWSSDCKLTKKQALGLSTRHKPFYRSLSFPCEAVSCVLNISRE